MIKQLKRTKHRISETVVALFILLPTATHAASIESILNKGVHFLQGPVAKSAGLLAIVGSGFLCLYKQQLPKDQFVMILVGLGIIFGGSSLYSTLVG